MSLTNEDLAATPPEKRTWEMKHFAALWIGMAVCIPTYTMASGLIDQGMNWWQALLCVGLGNLIVLVPMVLNAHAGTKYGIPFPVFARASFGVMGANVPALLRALVACGWFGIQAWLGGQALWQLLLAMAPGLEGPLTSAGMKEAIGIHPGELLGFAVFWAMNLYFIVKGTESIKFLELYAAPFLIAVGLALLGWAWVKADGFGPILSQPSKFTDTGSFMAVFVPGLTAMVGFWATLSLNIPDFTRYARSQRDQVVGQALGLPGTMVLFSFIGVAVTSATPIIFGGETIWDPVKLLGRVGGPLVTLLAMAALSIATLSTNLAANVVSPANDFSNLAPSKISYKMGGIITAVIGAIIFPWKLIESSGGYIFTWLIGYSALLGPVAGIMVADYFLVRRRELSVEDLYRRGGQYEFSGGVNWKAMLALAIGVAVNVPGFLAEAVPGLKDSVPGFWRTLYTYAWFVGFLLSGALHYAFAALSAPPRSAARLEPGG
ncbi:NCS1 family nucleobase:cation symporter-1 [Hyalangium sp.]|uniref:NCS1 family nucleobase:cation symporter-1 n=1 Tax=Hyalangium sp. TaxID=2028555 RepID=UPI002D4EB129|nr:NCS1 family nucleobase:cation symporter-1 [Hyalangium sp.]HYH96356.1 NCS1 family nucleobase:cation symporter-1 [Hyalangium sp.]